MGLRVLLLITEVGKGQSD